MGGDYVAYHVRRGDFQHKQTQWSADKILLATEKLIDRRSERVVYVSTDEGNARLVLFIYFPAIFHKAVFTFFFTSLLCIVIIFCIVSSNPFMTLLRKYSS